MVLFDGEIQRLAEEFKACQKVLLAIGDENRQHLILTLMQTERFSGFRVGEIGEKVNLSRPAVSHHIKVLKEAGIVKVRKEGTQNFYYFDADMSALNQLIDMLQHTVSIMERLPDYGGED